VHAIGRPFQTLREFTDRFSSKARVTIVKHIKNPNESLVVFEVCIRISVDT